MTHCGSTGKMIYLEFLDSAYEEGWTHKTVAPAHVTALGWLVSETEEFLVITAAISTGGHMFYPLTIPRAVILKRTDFPGMQTPLA